VVHHGLDMAMTVGGWVGGWAWAKNSKAKSGWVPAHNLSGLPLQLTH
jgi:hypothetical protein